MAFTIIPASNGEPTTGYSFPNRVSFCVSDDGGGGQILINGIGVNAPTVAGAVDLKTFFGSAAWHSQPLLHAFKPVANVTAASNQFNNNLDFSSVFIAGAGVAGALGVIALYVGMGPFFSIAGPSVAGIWRVELKLRHSLPG